MLMMIFQAVRLETDAVTFLSLNLLRFLQLSVERTKTRQSRRLNDLMYFHRMRRL